MKTVVKRSGNTEDFNRKKIEDSIRYAGGDWLTAKEIAGRIHERDGMATSEVRMDLVKELKDKNADLSERYSRARRFKAKNSKKSEIGVAGLCIDSIEAMNIAVGDSLEIKYRNRCKRMRIEEDRDPEFHNEIMLNEKDMAALGVVEGNRVLARKQR